MILDQDIVIPAPVERVWDFLMDIPAVSGCVPGVESFDAIDPDTYQGALKVKVGPISVLLQGKIRVAERDHEHLRSSLEVSAAEKRIASTVNATATMSLAPRGDHETEMHIHTDAAILGKLGEFGQAVIRRKADQVMQEFAANLSRALSSPET